MTNTTVSYPTNIMPLICDCKNLMDRDWVVQVQPIYCEANACANALAKRGTHQQNLLSVYNSCPSFVYMYYVPVWIRLIVFWVSHFLLFFSFFSLFLAHMNNPHGSCTWIHCVEDKVHSSYIVHALFIGLTTTLFRKKILKMSLTILFTHLKFILLQCF